MARHKAIIAISPEGLMVVDGSKCQEWPLWGRYGLLRPNGISMASSNSAGALLSVIAGNDNGG